MQNYTTRLDRLEQAIYLPSTAKYVNAYMHFDDRGVCATLEIDGRTFTPRPGESEEALCERARREAGRADYSLILVQFIKAGANGGMAPGFERFAK